MRKKILIVFGTRPEAIKMAPLVKQFKQSSDRFEVGVCVTAQHREMLDQILNFFEIKPDFDLNLMKKGQDLFSLSSDVLCGLKSILMEFSPDYVFVHGDTTTSTFAALASYYHGTKVCHVEAGLRTFNKYSPFPEEINRQLTGRLADYHFAPTEVSKENLLVENIKEDLIVVTGNTVIDALIWADEKLNNYQDDELQLLKNFIHPDRKVILVTGHRRENFGEGFLNICAAIKEIAVKNPGVDVIYPVHLNPNVQRPVYEILENITNVHLISPLGYPAFVWLMKKSYLILTDSGGVQEEAPSLGKPVLVMRDTTERPEAVKSGTVILVGTDIRTIVDECHSLLANVEKYTEMSLLHNPYGDGLAAKRIVDFITKINEAGINF